MTRMHLRSRRSAAVTCAAVLLVSASAARAASPEQICQSGRHSALAKYAACQQKAAAKFYATGDSSKYESIAMPKCFTKYTAIWSKLQARAVGSGSFCDNPRFTDNGDGTVTDRLTGLQWEMKTSLDGSPNLPDPHDADNTYTWTNGGGSFTAADGTAFTSLLPALNGGGCLGGQCDWRMPTIAELETILAGPYVCTTLPCIDPIFGPTATFGPTWSATSNDAAASLDAFAVGFADGNLATPTKAFLHFVRAVRGGL